MKKVYWVSRHDLSMAQVQALSDLHGDTAEIIKDPAVFNSTNGLCDYIRKHKDGFVYAVAGAPHYIAATLAGLRFGVFENHPKKREDGSFGLAAVYHVDGSLKKVWVNSDPMSDRGEALVKVARIYGDPFAVGEGCPYCCGIIGRPVKDGGCLCGKLGQTVSDGGNP